VNIRCEQCGTTYQLDEQLLGSSGSKVRCSRCGHVFWVEFPDSQEITPVVDATEEEPLQPSEEEMLASLQSRSLGKILQGAGLFLLFFLLAASIRFLYLQHNHPDQSFNTIARRTFFWPTDMAGNQQFVFQRVTRYFLDNQKMGKIFVVEGEVKNNYEDPRDLVRIRGTLQRSNQQAAGSREVYAGWSLTPEEMESLSFEEINRLPQRQPERFSPETRILPSKSVPFMILFPAPARDLTLVAVEVMSSRKVESFSAVREFK
jgi:predicted Zn finger-like uncharacterized protein